MRVFRLIAPLAALLLGACYTSAQPLFSAGDGKLPIPVGKYRLGDSTDVITLSKVDGNHYQARRTGDSSKSELILIPLGNREGLYVAQSIHAKNPTPLYGVVRVRNDGIAVLQPDCKTQPHRDVAAAVGAIVERNMRECRFMSKGGLMLAFDQLAGTSPAEQWQALVPVRR